MCLRLQLGNVAGVTVIEQRHSMSAEIANRSVDL
jgi:hypothetical protein